MVLAVGQCSLLQSDKDDWPEVSRKLVQLYFYLVAITGFPKAAEVANPKAQTLFKLSITFANVPLVIASHMTKPSLKNENRFGLLMRVTTKKH